MLQNAIMGSVYSRHVLGYTNPRVGLMSIGSEDEKGNDFTRESFDLLKGSGLNFHGNVEGHDLFENPVEVVVADGFTGNIVLKTSEAIAHAIFAWLKHELFKSPITKLGALLAKPAFKTIHKKTSADEYGGMPLLGVNGVCIIAHGGSSPIAVKNAIRMARESINHQVNPHIVEAVQRYHEKLGITPAHATA
jgi:glycerol-3-phosphate acyltransferase PlsX